jgi:hypothetical protein
VYNTDSKEYFTKKTYVQAGKPAVPTEKCKILGDSLVVSIAKSTVPERKI